MNIKVGDIVICYTNFQKRKIDFIGEVLELPDGIAFECLSVRTPRGNGTRVAPSRVERSPINDTPLWKALKEDNGKDNNK